MKYENLRARSATFEDLDRPVARDLVKFNRGEISDLQRIG
jgi:hypothetical protein